MLNPDVRLEWFVSFLAVIETGSFVAAAESTKRSQPRVSMHVAALEREIGLPLFDRRKRPVELTEAGVVLADHAHEILRALESAEAAMAPWRSGARGVVTLGSYPSASAAFVPALLQGLARTSPEVRVVLVERSTLELDDALTSGAVDVYLRPMSPPPSSASVRSRLLWGESLVAIHPSEHPLAEVPDPLSVDAVAEHPIVSIGRLDAPETPDFETYRTFRDNGHEIEPVQATNQPQTLVSMVRQGIGVGVTNSLAAQVADVDGVRVRRLKGAPERRVAVCWDSSRPLTPSARTLLRAIVRARIPAGTHAVPAAA
ncbi:LysR family transcriptional regulator [Streptomyces sp. CMB-StM0423]|uniref:LysR family transcriptional regulator n=1 Tax=unclassified Streptomyces TaxID=2593676 RepID=UPI000C70DEE3|nr:LysR family transcriptional regulator [Streptomyces sp. CMB-StM0423]AUH45017.1 LysR family transcriptional regulator [Streptomyces sp. CMB-StM0423]